MKHFGKKSVPVFLLFLILFGFSNCNPKVEEPAIEPVAAPKQIVEVSEAKDMYDRYGERRVPLIQRYEDSINRGTTNDKMQQMPKGDANKAQMQASPAKFDVARYVYYDYATIKNYIAYIEQEAKAANVEISTLRLYFSNYSDAEKFPDGSPVLHPRQNSIMLSPTIKKGKQDYLFYIGENEGRAEAVLLNDAFGPVDTSGMGAASSRAEKLYASFLFAPSETKTNNALPNYQNGKSLSMNRGGGVPPPYN